MMKEEKKYEPDVQMKDGVINFNFERALKEEEKTVIRKTFDVLLERMFNEESEYQSMFIDFPYWFNPYEEELGVTKFKRYKITISKYEK